MKTCEKCQTVCQTNDCFCRHCGHTKFNLKKIGTKVQDAKMLIEIEIECPVCDEKKIREEIMKEKKFPADCTKIKIKDISKEFSDYRYVSIKTNPYICNSCRQVVSNNNKGVCSNCLSENWRKRKVMWFGDDSWDGWTSDTEPDQSDRNIKWHAEEQFND